MTVLELEKRVIALEKAVEQLRARMENGSIAPSEDPRQQRHWWHDDAGRFANDPVFDEIVRLGREYRESLHPDRRKKKRARKKNADS
jgi:hypothetical protein